MFDSVAAGETVDADASAALAEQHARIAREQFREIDWVTTLFVIRCEEDARAGRNEARHGEFAHVEVAGILALTESAARRMIDLGCGRTSSAACSTARAARPPPDSRSAPDG